MANNNPLVTALLGTETIQVLGQDANGHPAAAREMTNTQSIAQLAGAGAFGGTFVANGTASVTVNNTNVALGNAIVISLNTPGGTVGAMPTIKTLTPASGFTVTASAGDTSTYNYGILG